LTQHKNTTQAPASGGDDHERRLNRIKQLWAELQSVQMNTPEYDDLVKRIRREADAFVETLDRLDPTG
jgi:conjugal transfer/entry exclusion protein